MYGPFVPESVNDECGPERKVYKSQRTSPL